MSFPTPSFRWTAKDVRKAEQRRIAGSSTVRLDRTLEYSTILSILYLFLRTHGSVRRRSVPDDGAESSGSTLSLLLIVLAIIEL
jgi:hypothetical protein